MECHSDKNSGPLPSLNKGFTLDPPGGGGATTDSASGYPYDNSREVIRNQKQTSQI